VVPLPLAMRTTSGAGSCCCRQLSPSCPVPHSSPLVAVSPPRGASVPPTPIEQRRLPTTISLSKLNHAALVLDVYASQLSFPLSRSYGHARLASSWWPAFTGRGSIPRKAPNEVSASSTWHPPHPSFATQSMSEFGSSPVLRAGFRQTCAPALRSQWAVPARTASTTQRVALMTRSGWTH
jgi:hypothetical protein